MMKFCGSYSIVGWSFFSPSLGLKGERGDGMEYWGGYIQSVRPTQMGLSLNIGMLDYISFMMPTLVFLL